MRARRTVEITQGKCRNKYESPSAYRCKGCVFFHGSVGNSGPYSDSVSCEVRDDISNNVDHPIYGAIYETWDSGGQCVARPKKKRKRR